jgi:hypothetical protein
VVDALADRTQHLGRGRGARAGHLLLTDAQRARVDLAAVVARHRAHDRLVAVCAYVLDDLEHALAHRRIEDAARLAREQLRALRGVERRPAQLAQRTVRHSCLHRS